MLDISEITAPPCGRCSGCRAGLVRRIMSVGLPRPHHLCVCVWACAGLCCECHLENSSRPLVMSLMARALYKSWHPCDDRAMARGSREALNSQRLGRGRQHAHQRIGGTPVRGNSQCGTDATRSTSRDVVAGAGARTQWHGTGRCRGSWRSAWIRAAALLSVSAWGYTMGDIQSVCRNTVCRAQQVHNLVGVRNFGLRVRSGRAQRGRYCSYSSEWSRPRIRRRRRSGCLGSDPQPQAIGVMPHVEAVEVPDFWAWLPACAWLTGF